MSLLTPSLPSPCSARLAIQSNIQGEGGFLEEEGGGFAAPFLLKPNPPLRNEPANEGLPLGGEGAGGEAEASLQTTSMGCALMCEASTKRGHLQDA